MSRKEWIDPRAGNASYAAFMRRAVTAHGKRAGHDLEALRDLAELQELLEATMLESVASLRSEEGGSYSWTDIGTILGVTRQAAAQRFAGAGGVRKVGGQPANLR